METIDLLLDAAEQRIRKHGYNAVSFRDLAADANIKSASVHYHFPTKEDLGVTLVQRYRERFFAAVEAKTAKARTPHARLRGFCEVYRGALAIDDAICLCGILGAESAGLPPPLSESVADFFAANIAWIREALDPAWPASRRSKFAVSALASLQGALMVATTLKDASAFEHVVEMLLASVPR
jgi:TetR/AcrR family transcriptional repressor of nem operon